MTYEEKLERAKTMRSRDIFGAVPQEELDAAPAYQTEIYVPVSEDMKVHVYRLVPKTGVSEKCPMIINFHGGGFIKGRQTKDQLFCSEIADEFKCLVWDVDYSLAPEYPYPTAVNESYGVVKYAFEHCEELGVDPERILLMGHSAGGNLAISVCIKNGETGEIHPVALIAEYTPMDLATNPAEKPRAEGDMPAEVAKAYNEFYIDPETAVSPYASPIFAQPEQLATFPNTLIISASKDSLCYEDEEFAINLARAGVSVTCKRFQNTPHGFTINRNGEWQASQAMIKNFIAHHF